MSAPVLSGCNCPAAYVGPSLMATCGGGPFLVFMGLLDSFLRTQCDLLDPCGRVIDRGVFHNEYDFVVIGGGSGGAVVANRLSEYPEWKVLLLEAGGDEPPGTQVPSMVINYHGTDIDWAYKTEPEDNACFSYPDKRCSWTRGKVLGGCSVLNGMMYLRGNRKDYDDWAAAGNPGWSYKDVLPYFIKSEDNLQINEMEQGYHGKGGFLTVQQFPHRPKLAEDILKAGEELGYNINKDLNGAVHTGFAIAQTTSRNGSRLSSARAFLRPIRNRSNLHVFLNSTVTKVQIDKTTIRVTGVEFVRNGKKENVRVSKEVILSAGAVGSPQILLLSGVGPKEDLNRVGVPVIHDLPGVGKNLHNHVAFFVNFILRNRTASFDLDWATAMEYILNRKGPMSSTGLSQVTAKLNSKYADKSGTNPDIQFFFGGYLANCARTGTVGDLVDPDTPHAEPRISISPVVLHPKSRGYLTLKSKDPLDHPLIYGNYFNDSSDIATLLEALKVALRLGETRTLKEGYGFELDTSPVHECIDVHKHQFNTDAYWECAFKYATGPENHQVGSCKMGPARDKMAVVDPQLKVYGITGLRVMDASVIPTVVSGNTAAPIMMIAEKGTDFIKRVWKRSPWASNNEDVANRFGTANENNNYANRTDSGNSQVTLPGVVANNPGIQGYGIVGSRMGNGNYNNPGRQSPYGYTGGKPIPHGYQPSYQPRDDAPRSQPTNYQSRMVFPKEDPPRSYHQPSSSYNNPTVGHTGGFQSSASSRSYSRSNTGTPWSNHG